MAYNKHVFKKGQVVTSEQLNRMEDQIALNEQHIAQGGIGGGVGGGGDIIQDPEDEMGGVVVSGTLADIDKSLTLDNYAADAKVVGDKIGNIKEEIANKLTKPSTVEVGKYFRVASIDSDGNPVLEAVNLPIATNSTAGLTYARATSDGLGINDDGRLYVAKCTDTHIANKSDTARPICPNQIDNVLRAGLISNSQITDTDKPDICQTIGAVFDMDAVTMLASITLEENSVIKITGFAADEVYAEVILPKNTSAPGMNYAFYANNSQLCGIWFSSTGSADSRKISTFMIQCFGDRYYPTVSQYQVESNGSQIQRYAQEYRYLFASRKTHGKIDEFRTTGQLPAGTVIKIYGH